MCESVCVFFRMMKVLQPKGQEQQQQRQRRICSELSAQNCSKDMASINAFVCVYIGPCRPIKRTLRMLRQTWSGLGCCCRSSREEEERDGPPARLSLDDLLFQHAKSRTRASVRYKSNQCQIFGPCGLLNGEAYQMISLLFRFHAKVGE